MILFLKKAFAALSFLFVVFLFYYTMVAYDNGAFAQITETEKQIIEKVQKDYPDSELKYEPFVKGMGNMSDVCHFYNGTLHVFNGTDESRQYCIVR